MNSCWKNSIKIFRMNLILGNCQIILKFQIGKFCYWVVLVVKFDYGNKNIESKLKELN